MKTSVLLACAIGVACAGQIQAADLKPLPPGQTKAVAYSASPSWAGPYIGFQAGHVWGGGETTLPATGEFHLIDPKGFAGGIVAGHSGQWGRLVAGLEADLSFVSASQTIDTGFAPAPAATQLKSSIDWNSHLRGRVGYAADFALLYVAGGLAVAGVESKAIDNNAGNTATWTKTRVGWTVGGGAEFRVHPSASVRLEYLYDNYGTASLEAQTVGGTAFAERDHKLDSHTLRAGMNWRF